MPMNPVRIKDNSQKNDLSGIQELADRIADKTLEQLESEGVFVFPDLADTEDVERNQKILQSCSGGFQAGNVMGFLGFGSERLVIESRFCGEGEDFFFQYLLQRVLDIPNIVDLKTDADQENPLFDFLLFLFPYRLKTAMRKGLFKRYVWRRFNDMNVKGRIDVARHVERNTPFIGKVAYSLREFSHDNYLTELIRHTIEFIKGKPFGSVLLSRVKDEVQLVVQATQSYGECDRRKVIEENKKNTVRHAYYREYRELQRLCLLILQYRKHRIGSGPRLIHGILFDGAWLWEEYIATLVGDSFYHPMNKSGKGRQDLFFDENGRKVGEIYPDFIGKETRVIADAKYKPIENIGRQDYHQLLAYMFRFDAKRGYYFYPETTAEMARLKLWMCRGSTYERNVKKRDDVCVAKFGLTIPQDAESYEDFVALMKTNEDEFKRDLLDPEIRA